MRRRQFRPRGAVEQRRPAAGADAPRRRHDGDHHLQLLPRMLTRMGTQQDDRIVHVAREQRPSCHFDLAGMREELIGRKRPPCESPGHPPVQFDQRPPTRTGQRQFVLVAKKRVGRNVPLCLGKAETRVSKEVAGLCDVGRPDHQVQIHELTQPRVSVELLRLRRALHCHDSDVMLLEQSDDTQEISQTASSEGLAGGVHLSQALSRLNVDRVAGDRFEARVEQCGEPLSDRRRADRGPIGHALCSDGEARTPPRCIRDQAGREPEELIVCGRPAGLAWVTPICGRSVAPHASIIPATDEGRSGDRRPRP